MVGAVRANHHGEVYTSDNAVKLGKASGETSEETKVKYFRAGDARHTGSPLVTESAKDKKIKEFSAFHGKDEKGTTGISAGTSKKKKPTIHLYENTSPANLFSTTMEE